MKPEYMDFRLGDEEVLRRLADRLDELPPDAYDPHYGIGLRVPHKNRGRAEALIGGQDRRVERGKLLVDGSFDPKLPDFPVALADLIVGISATRAGMMIFDYDVVRYSQHILGLDVWWSKMLLAHDFEWCDMWCGLPDAYAKGYGPYELVLSQPHGTHGGVIMGYDDVCFDFAENTPDLKAVSTVLRNLAYQLDGLRMDILYTTQEGYDE